MRARGRSIAWLAVLALATVPSAALAQQGSPFAPLPPAPAPTTQAPQNPTTPQVPVEEEGLSGLETAFIGLAALGLIALIGIFIARDARSSAPAEGRPLSADDLDRQTERTKGSRAPPQRRAVQSRKQGKAARRARKRNRPA